MPIPEGYHDSDYTRGELKGLIAPILGCEPEDIGEIVIVAVSANGGTIGVHTTLTCPIKEHWQTRVQCMLADGISSMATAIHEQAKQHGPGE